MAGAETRDFEAVYRVNASRFRVYAATHLRAAGLSEHAEDVVHNAVHSLWQNPPGRVESWEALMFATIRWRAIDLIKRVENQRADKSAAPKNEGGEQTDGADDWTQKRLDTGRNLTGGDYPHRDDPSVALERSELIDSVRAAISRLPSPDKEIVTRIKLHGEMGKSIAEELSITPGRVSQILKRALATLAHDTQLQEVR